LLLPLDEEILRMRLEVDDFRLDRKLGGQVLSLHFGPEFPGDALALYPRFLTTVGEDAAVDGTYIVVDPSDGEVVGQVGTLGPPEGDEVEIGYGINPSAQGRGIATASVAALVETLRARRGVGSIIARTAVANPASGRVLEKNGFAVTGRAASDEGELLVWTHRASCA
jgi:RimJ/RimL family protein N-acetyltransferase